MARKVIILDSSVLCVWLQVPGFETCGSGAAKMDYGTVSKKITEEESSGTTFVLPLAAIIETGNHITHARNNYDQIQHFADLLLLTADEISPWAAFTQQSALWNPDGIKALAERWRNYAVSGQSIGDASILDVAEYYNKLYFDVEILTGDEQLRSFQPAPIPTIGVPRRKK